MICASHTVASLHSSHKTSAFAISLTKCVAPCIPQSARRCRKPIGEHHIPNVCREGQLKENCIRCIMVELRCVRAESILRFDRLKIMDHSILRENVRQRYGDSLACKITVAFRMVPDFFVYGHLPFAAPRRAYCHGLRGSSRHLAPYYILLRFSDGFNKRTTPSKCLSSATD